MSYPASCSARSRAAAADRGADVASIESGSRRRALGLTCVGLVGWLAVLIAGRDVAVASVPKIPLPEWIRVETAITKLPELDRPGELVAVIERLAGKTWGDGKAGAGAGGPGPAWTLALPAGLTTTRPVTGSIAAASDARTTLTFDLRANAPIDGGQIVLAVTAQAPRRALLVAAARLFAGDAAQLAQARALIAHLPQSQTIQAASVLSVTRTESWRASEGPIARRYLSAPGHPDVAFAILETRPGSSLDALSAQRGRLLADQKRLQRRKRGPGQTLEQRNLVLDLARTTLQMAVEEAAASRLHYAQERIAEVVDAELAASPGLRAVRQLLAGALAALAGDWAGARATWKALEDNASVSTRIRAYAAFNQGELDRLGGGTGKESYQRALAQNPALTVARARLERR